MTSSRSSPDPLQEETQDAEEDASTIQLPPSDSEVESEDEEVDDSEVDPDVDEEVDDDEEVVIENEDQQAEEDIDPIDQDEPPPSSSSTTIAQPNASDKALKALRATFIPPTTQLKGAEDWDAWS